MPVRKITMGSRGVRGFIPTPKANEPLEFESKLERDFYLLFDFDNTVWHLEAQPIKIEFEIDGRKASYIPDIHIRRSDGLPDIIGEIKYYGTLRKEITTLRPKFEAARMYCDDVLENTVFMIFTDKCPEIRNRIFIKNIHFLMQYTDFKIETYERVLKLYYKDMTIRELLNELSSEKMEQMNYVKDIWALVRKGVLEIDLSRELTPHSTIANMYRYEKRFDEENKVGLVEGGYLV